MEELKFCVKCGKFKLVSEFYKKGAREMKKNISILLIVLCILAISTLILFAEEAKYDFRKTNWGMSKEQVKATEDKKPDYEDNFQLSYDEVTISGKDFACVYYFF